MASTLLEYLIAGTIVMGVAAGRYLAMTGAYYLVVYKLFARRLAPFKVDPRPPKAEDMRHEIKWGLLNTVNFGIIGAASYWLYKQGWLAFYFDLDRYGLLYAIGIIPVLLVIHDAYFYWSHWLMHRPWFRKASHHAIHHQVHNVSPWSAFSVHPVEGFIEVMFRPLLFMVIPLHPLTLAIFAFITFALNIIGHSGYEFFPAGYASSPLTRLNSCAAFHYMHHQDGRYNLGLFMCHWDRLMGTLHPDYEAFYERTVRRTRFRLPAKIDARVLRLRTWWRGEAERATG